MTFNPLNIELHVRKSLYTKFCPKNFHYETFNPHIIKVNELYWQRNSILVLTLVFSLHCNKPIIWKYLVITL